MFNTDLLRETNKEEYRDIFSNKTKFPAREDSGELSPSHGFKRNLVQLLGNMSYRNRCNQDKVSWTFGKYEIASFLLKLSRYFHL